MPRRQQYIFTEEPRRGKGLLIGFIIILAIALAGLFTANLAMVNTVSYTREYVTIPNLHTDLDNGAERV